MLKLYYVILLMSTVTYTYAAVAIFAEEEKPAEFAHQEGCYLSVLKKVLPFDEPYYPRDNKTCAKYSCSKNTKLTHVFTCGVVLANPGCPLVEDLTKDYPDCCPKNDVCPLPSASKTGFGITEKPVF